LFHSLKNNLALAGSLGVVVVAELGWGSKGSCGGMMKYAISIYY
jgi:hypothetical protein